MKEKWTLKKYIYSIFGILIIGIISIMGIFQVTGAYIRSKEIAEQHIEMNAEIGMEKIVGWFNEKKSAFETLADEIEIKQSYNNMQELKGYLFEQNKKKEDMLEIFLAKPNGELTQEVDSSFNPTSRPWYRGAMQTEDTYISEPYIDVNTNQLVITLSRKIVNNGVTEAILGADISLEEVKRIVNTFVEEGGEYAILINNKGEILAHPQEEYNSTAEKILNIMDIGDYSEVISNKEGSTATIKSERGEQVYSQVTSIQNSGLKLIVNYPTKDMITSIASEVIKCIMIIIIGLIISNIVVVAFVKKFITPIGHVVEVLRAFANGNFHCNIENISKNSYELDILVGGLNSFSQTSKAYIGEITEILYQLSKGNLNVIPQQEYIADFQPIKEALVNILDKLNNTITNINQSVEEVSNGAEEIAQGATELAQGAVEQADVIEEFIASTEEIAQNINATVKKANETSRITQEAKGKADTGIEVMEKMLVSMNDINTSSRSISEVLKSIDNIASQTNLLALNAAIESARAGEAGRGFAVVANEIRDLANKSSEIVKETEDMIKISLQSAEIGQTMANDTAKALREIVASVEKTTEITMELLENSRQQKELVEGLVKGTEQITTVVESNSMAAQGSAAISEELAAQSENLKVLMDYFEIKR